MDHQAISRPPMPGSTPTPGSLKNSVYSTNVPARLDRHKTSAASAASAMSPDSPGLLLLDQSVDRRFVRTPNKTSAKDFTRSTSAKQRQRVLQEKTLSKIVAKLPYDLRETVTAVLTMAFSTSENIQKDLDVSHQETTILRSELTKKVSEIQTLQKNVDNYRGQIKSLEESIESLKDNIGARQKFSLKNRSAMSRLATTNRMLIDALDALQGGSSSVQSMQEKQHQKAIGSLLNSSSLDEQPPLLGRNGQLEPLPSKTHAPTDEKEYEEKVTNMASTQNEKLRESLLKIAREHYRSMKNVEHLEIKVSEYKLSLRAQEQVNRNLKTELDELKTIHMADAQAFEDNKALVDATNMTFHERSFGILDDRFKVRVDYTTTFANFRIIVIDGHCLHIVGYARTKFIRPCGWYSAITTHSRPHGNFSDVTQPE
jgi:predicted nuclease with TOPRIM domain